MNVNVTLNLDEIKARLCPKCQKALDNYIKQLAIQALKKDNKETK